MAKQRKIGMPISQGPVSPVSSPLGAPRRLVADTRGKWHISNLGRGFIMLPPIPPPPGSPNPPHDPGDGERSRKQESTQDEAIKNKAGPAILLAGLGGLILWQLRR
jgi:hypothetical protein